MTSLTAELDNHARRRPDAPALIGDSTTMSYGELLQVIARPRAMLVDHGGVPDDRGVICSENTAACPISPFDPDALLVRLCERARPKLVFTPRRERLPGALPLRIALDDVLATRSARSGSLARRAGGTRRVASGTAPSRMSRVSLEPGSCSALDSHDDRWHANPSRPGVRGLPVRLARQPRA